MAGNFIMPVILTMQKCFIVRQSGAVVLILPGTSQTRHIVNQQFMEHGTLSPMHIMVISVEAVIGGNTKQWSKADGKIDFSKSALRIKNFIRGMTPWPGAFTKTEKGILKILKADTAESSGGDINGEVVVSDPKNGLIVKCGEGYLDLKIIQNENGKAMDSKAYLLGHKISVGSVFGD